MEQKIDLDLCRYITKNNKIYLQNGEEITNIEIFYAKDLKRICVIGEIEGQDITTIIDFDDYKKYWFKSKAECNLYEDFDFDIENTDNIN